MAATWNNQLQTVYNISGNPVIMFPPPIVQTRAPGATDYGQPGQLWIFGAAVYISISSALNAAVWQLVEAGGGAGVFATLHVTGVSNLDGNVIGGAAIGAATTLTAGTGITATTGNIVATAGNITAAAGTISGGTIVATTDLEGLQVFATGDSTAGVAGTTSFSNGLNPALGVHANTLLGVGVGNPNTGYIKIYVGTGVAYVPYWLAAVV